VGGDYVGWCPLGYRDRPVLVYDRLGRGTRGGFGVARGSTVAQTPWTYLRRGDMGARDLTRRRVTLDGRSVQQVRIVDAPHVRLSRDFAVTEAPAAGVARAVPRSGTGRLGLPDTAADTRGDSPTGIRRRGRGIEDAHPTDTRAQRRPEEAADPGASARRRPGEAEARTPDRAQRERDGSSQADREVLRPMFRPLSRTRPEGRDAAPPAAEARPRNDSETRPRNDPESRPRSDVESRRGGGEGRPVRQAEPAPRSEPRRDPPPEPRRESQPPPRREAEPRHESESRREAPPRHEAEPRHEAPPPPPAAAARRPRREQ
jgi:hypothetical protein